MPKLHNTVGALRRQWPFNSRINSIEISLDFYKPGIYILSMRNSYGVYQAK